MASVILYTTPMCPFCWRAKRLLQGKGVTFEEIDLWQEPQRRAEMIERAEGRRTVPQIFIDGHGIGGANELIALDRAGRLDILLSAGQDSSTGNDLRSGAADPSSSLES